MVQLDTGGALCIYTDGDSGQTAEDIPKLFANTAKPMPHLWDISTNYLSSSFDHLFGRGGINTNCKD